jgi:hypothetical protein
VILAQFSQFLPAPPSPLPSPPIIERLLFEQPWGPALLIAGCAAGVWFFAKGKLRAPIAAALLVLAAGLVVMAHLVHTDRERMTQATNDLVDAVASADVAAIDRLLAPDARAYSRYHIPGYSGGQTGMDKGEILAQVPVVIRANPISEHRVQELQAQSRGPGVGTTQALIKIVVRAEQLGQEIPVQSWWRLDWRRDSDGLWRATAIEPVSIPAAAAGP